MCVPSLGRPLIAAQRQGFAHEAGYLAPHFHSRNKSPRDLSRDEFERKLVHSSLSSKDQSDTSELRFQHHHVLKQYILTLHTIEAGCRIISERCKGRGRTEPPPWPLLTFRLSAKSARI